MMLGTTTNSNTGRPVRKFRQTPPRRYSPEQDLMEHRTARLRSSNQGDEETYSTNTPSTPAFKISREQFTFALSVTAITLMFFLCNLSDLDSLDEERRRMPGEEEPHIVVSGATSTGTGGNSIVNGWYRRNNFVSCASRPDCKGTKTEDNTCSVCNANPWRNTRPAGLWYREDDEDDDWTQARVGPYWYQKIHNNTGSDVTPRPDGSFIWWDDTHDGGAWKIQGPGNHYYYYCDADDTGRITRVTPMRGDAPPEGDTVQWKDHTGSAANLHDMKVG